MEHNIDMIGREVPIGDDDEGGQFGNPKLSITCNKNYYGWGEGDR